MPESPDLEYTQHFILNRSSSAFLILFFRTWFFLLSEQRGIECERVLNFVGDFFCGRHFFWEGAFS